MMVQFFHLLKLDPQRALDCLEKIESEFEVQDSLTVMVLKTKLQALIQGDSFVLQKEFMMELEDLSNTQTCDGKIISKAKRIILAEMLKKNQLSIAQNYLKKCLLHKSGDLSFTNNLLKAASKMFVGTEGVSFVLDLVKKAAFDDPHHKIFSNMLLSLRLEERQPKSLTLASKVYQTQLSCYRFQQDLDIWIQYLHFLWLHDRPSAQREYERALIVLDNGNKGFGKNTNLVLSDINLAKANLMREYAQITKSNL